jgi:hypothetical protein
MCVQAVGLIQGAIERQGITTVSISLLREVTEVIRPPRALFVPYPLGYPLGSPKDSCVQHGIISAGLSILKREDVPVLVNFEPEPQSLNARGNG